MECTWSQKSWQLVRGGQPGKKSDLQLVLGGTKCCIRCTISEKNLM